MKTRFFGSHCARLAMLLLAWTVTISQCLAQTENTKELDHEFVFVHFDLAELAKSQSGKRIVDSIEQIPLVKKQLDAIPANLQFLLDTKLDSLTVHVEADQNTEMCLLRATGEFDSTKLCELLSHGKQYTKVQFAEVEIHHWVTDFDALFQDVFGQLASEGAAEPDADPLFMAMPKPTELLISTSLSQLTSTLADPSNRLATSEKYFSKFGDGCNLVLFRQQTGGIPGDLSAVVREKENGMLHIQSSLVARTEQELQVAESVASILASPETAAQMFAFVPAEEIGEGNPKTAPEAKPAKTSHENQLSIGLRLNPGSLPVNDWKGMLTCFLKESVECRRNGNELEIDVKVFLGPCQFAHQPKDESNALNRSQLTFNAYTSEVEKEAADRIAEAQNRESDLKRR